MGDKSEIEWTDATWNPIVGCSIKSPGCKNCYAMRMARRIELMGTATHYAGLTDQTKAGPVFNGKLAAAPDHILTAPLRWTKPRKIFVNSMGDLFHESAPDEWIDKVFAVMALCPQHQFQVLTKRAERMRAYMTARYTQSRIARAAMEAAPLNRTLENAIDFAPREDPAIGFEHWPLPNVWLGVSAERQQEADERIPHLLQTPAAVRFVSCEPLLGPIDLSLGKWVGLFSGKFDDAPTPQLDWIIVGGESGPGARPMHPDWARSLRDQCQVAGVPFFFKQWGAWWEVDSDARDAETGDHHVIDVDEDPTADLFDRKTDCMVAADGRVFRDDSALPIGLKCRWMTRLGKAAAGRILDGKEHNGFPNAA
jgi:protein gp37